VRREELREALACRLVVTTAGVLRPMDMERDEPIARVRKRRRRALASELVPMVRRLNPMMPDDQVLGMADNMAELRLLDEELG
jgi:hypothetical protein